MVKPKLTQIHTEGIEVPKEELNKAVNTYIWFVMMSFLLLILFVLISSSYQMNKNNILLLLGFYLIAIPIVFTRYFNIKSRANANSKIFKWENYTSHKTKFKTWLTIEKVVNLLWIIGIIFNTVVNWNYN